MSIATWLFHKRNYHRATTAHLCAMYPFMSEGGLGNVGTLLGTDHAKRPFSFDEFKFYEAGLLTGPNSVVLGEVGSAKSSNVKMRIWRGAAFGRKAVVLDPKKEFAPLVDAFNAECDRLGIPHDSSVLSLRPGGDVVLNPLESSGNEQDRRGLALAIVAAAVGRELDAAEKDGVLRSLADCLTVDDNPTVPDLARRLLDPSPEMALDMRMTDAECRDTLRHCAYSLRQLSEGALAGMFDGPTSPGVSLDGRLVVLDLSAIEDGQALSILMTCATAWLNNRIHAERRAGDTTKRILVVDEAWRILADPMCAEWLQKGFKLSRSLGVAHCIVMHRLSDVRAAGDEGSRAQALAQGLVSDAQTKIIYRQMAGELPLLQATFGLTDAEASWLPHLPKGRALWKIGDRSMLVSMEPRGIEWQLTNTDQRMMNVPTLGRNVDALEVEV